MGLLLSYVSQENQYHTQFVDKKYINKRKWLQFYYFCLTNNLFSLQNHYGNDTVKDTYTIVINHNYHFKVINCSLGYNTTIDTFIKYMDALIPKKYKKLYGITEN
jgi:hypothetical protein